MFYKFIVYLNCQMSHTFKIKINDNIFSLICLYCLFIVLHFFISLRRDNFNDTFKKLHHHIS